MLMGVVDAVQLWGRLFVLCILDVGWRHCSWCSLVGCDGVVLGWFGVGGRWLLFWFWFERVGFVRLWFWWVVGITAEELLVLF